MGRIDPSTCNHVPENSRVSKNSTYCKRCKVVIEPKYNRGIKSWIPVMSKLHPYSYLISLQEGHRRQKMRQKK